MKSEISKEPLLIEEAEAPNAYQTTPYRWVILAIFCCNMATRSMLIIGLAPAAIEITRAYDLSSTIYVNMCTISFGVTQIILAPCALNIYQTYHVSDVLKACTFISFIGAMFRLFTIFNKEFWPVLLGTLLVAFTQPFYINVPSIIANKWFSDKERALATSIQLMSQLIGSMISFVMSFLIYNE